jgi:hypothetical protein
MIGAFVGATAGVFLRTWANQLGKQRRFARKYFFWAFFISLFFLVFSASGVFSYSCLVSVGFLSILTFFLLIRHLLTQSFFLFFLGPWNHLFLGFVGGYIGHNYSRWEKELLEDLNAKRKEKGLVEIKREDMTIFNTK